MVGVTSFAHARFGQRLGASLILLALGAACSNNKQTPAAQAGVEPIPPVPPREPLPCFIDSGTQAGSALSLRVTATRTGGVAPLAVFFDTEGTTSAATQRPFHELAYCWDFADPTSGAFGTTGISKNEAKGPVAAHVFERPGTYPVTVSARDALGRASTTIFEVTVEDPDVVYAGTATVCFSSSGNFGSCPAGAETVTTGSLGDLPAHVGSGKRLLLRRGETFSGSKVALNVQGPGTIGAFGDSSAAKPRITTSSTLFEVSNRAFAFRDWRIMDLEIVGQSADDGFAVDVVAKAIELTVLRMSTTNMGGSIQAGGSIIQYWEDNGYPGQDVIDQLAVQDSDFRDLVGGNGHNHAYVAAHHLMWLGNTMRNSTAGEHVFRAPWIDRGVFSSNVLAEAPEPRHLVKIHGPGFGDVGIGANSYTERIVLSDNVFHGTGGHAWGVALSPQNDGVDERLRDIIVERNFFLPGSAVSLLLHGTTDATVRDNIFNAGTCAEVNKRGLEPPANRITFLYNSCYSDGTPKLVQIGETPTNITAFGNLIFGPNAGDGALDDRLTEEAGNVVTTSPGTVGTDYMDWKNFALAGDSSLVDSATTAHLTPWDYSGRPRPIDGNASDSTEADVGALEYAP